MNFCLINLSFNLMLNGLCLMAYLIIPRRQTSCRYSYYWIHTALPMLQASIYKKTRIACINIMKEELFRQTENGKFHDLINTVILFGKFRGEQLSQRKRKNVGSPMVGSIFHYIIHRTIPRLSSLHVLEW
jgi:hypothetical protein